MSLFDITAVLITLAASFGYINYRFLRLPPATGILCIALLSSLLLSGVDSLFPAWRLEPILNHFLAGIDFNQALMHGMLCFLLFAGALHVKLEDLQANRWTILALATLGVLLSTVLVGGLAFGLLHALGLPVPLPLCLVFGALISPTDPIAVMGLLKELHAPKDLKATIAGESLFNDGVAVVAFFALVSFAGIGGEDDVSHLSFSALRLGEIFVQEVAGGILLGLGLGYLAFRMLKSINYHQLELLITLALVMFTYSLSFRLGVSGPIAVVVAGLLIGNQGKRLAMSQKTAEHVDTFWGMVDDILNAVLFLLIGLEVFGTPVGPRVLGAALGAVLVALAARFLSVLLPVSVLQWNKSPKGLVPILTWGGLRGGLSVAMALSLPDLPEKELILAATYGVVLFSVLAQGLTMRRLLGHYGVGRNSG
jgi:CPA1 family monovalent cation:H+ antiporter